MKKLILLVLMLPLVALADPGPAIQYLMKEPASLMDVGILRANIAVFEVWDDSFFHRGLTSRARLYEPMLPAKTTFEFDNPHAIVFYEFSNDLVVVAFFVQTSNEDHAARACKSGIDIMRVQTKDEFQEWFGHARYVTSTQPDKLFTQLGERIELRCFVTNSSHEELISGRSRLNEDAVFITQADGR